MYERKFCRSSAGSERLPDARVSSAVAAPADGAGSGARSSSAMTVTGSRSLITTRAIAGPDRASARRAAAVQAGAVAVEQPGRRASAHEQSSPGFDRKARAHWSGHVTVLARKEGATVPQSPRLDPLSPSH